MSKIPVGAFTRNKLGIHYFMNQKPVKIYTLFQWVTQYGYSYRQKIICSIGHSFFIVTGYVSLPYGKKAYVLDSHAEGDFPERCRYVFDPPLLIKDSSLFFSIFEDIKFYPVSKFIYLSKHGYTDDANCCDISHLFVQPSDTGDQQPIDDT